MPPHRDALVGRPMSRPAEPGNVGRLTVHRPVWGLCAALLGVAMLLLGAAGPAIVPGLIEDDKAIGTATSCTLSSPHDDCLRSFDATAARTVIKEQNKSSRYTLYLNGPTRVPGVLTWGLGTAAQVRDGDSAIRSWVHALTRATP